MNKPKIFIKEQQQLCPKAILVSILLVFLIVVSNPINAQGKNTNDNQWKSVGGQIVASGTHDFTNIWFAAGNGMWWKNNEDRSKAAAHTNEEVNKDVAVKKGQFTVKGPGFLAKFQRRVKTIAVGSGLKFAGSGKDFWTASLGGEDLLKGSDGNWRWVNYNRVDFDPTKNNEGWIPAGMEFTFEVWANNLVSGIGYTQYSAPVGVEYEYWFFPREGGQIISTADINNINDNNPGRIVGKVMTGSVFDETLNKWLKPGDNISTEHSLISGPNENATLTLFDASTTIKLNNNTSIIIKDQITKKQSKGVFLIAGRLWSLFKGKESSGYAIETYNSTLGVEGTEFETTYNPETGETHVSVFEGTVRFECKTGSEASVYLKAGMSASMDKNCNLISQNSTSNTISPAGVIKINPSGDSHVYAYSYSNWNNANWGKYEQLGAGWNPVGGEKRAFLKFDLSGVDPNSVDKATLKLYHNHTGGGNTVELGVYRVMSSWTEGRGTYNPASAALPGELTWNNQPQIDRYPVVYFKPGPVINNWVEVDVTSLVKAWLTGIPNYGLAIKAGENYIGGAESQYGFYSREYEDVEKRPQLVLNRTDIQSNSNIGNLDIPEIAGDWEISCNDGNIYKYNLKLVQYDKGFYGDMIRMNGNEANSKVEGMISQDGSIEFIRSRGNWKQYYTGSVVNYSGRKAIQMEGAYGTQEKKGSSWHANFINAVATNFSAAGQWKVNQHNGYQGILNLQQDPSGRITGTATWDRYESGTVDGQISGTNIEFTITYSGGVKGFYKGTLTQNGSGIINGTVTANNGSAASWDASKSETVQSIAEQWHINQHNGYQGTLKLQRTPSGRITGTATWDRYESGTVDGQISGTNIEFTITYSGGVKGFYKGTLAQNGNRIINGTVTANNGSTASWDATK